MQQDAEFTYSWMLIAFIVVVGGAATFIVYIVGYSIWNRITRKKFSKELYEQKERTNGQHKGGARGKW